MRRVFWAVALVLAAAVLARGADPIPKADGGPSPTIKLADLPGPLEAGQVYGIDLDVDVLGVQAFPPGLVTVERQAITAPTKMKATWADTGKFEWKTFKGKTTVTIEPVPGQDGEVTLVIVPAGAKTEADWKTQVIAVKSGKGPIPPPSALKSDVKTAYDRDPAEVLAKASLAKKLAALYRASASSQFLDKYKPSTTWYEVFQDVSTANAAQMGQTDLQGVRIVIQKYLDGRLPVDKKTVLDVKLAASEFGAVATALEALTK